MAELVVLDLDETLIHACSEWIGHSHDFIAANSMVHIRPGTKEFLDRIFKYYDVAIWTASTGQYLGQVVEKLFVNYKLEFIWDRTHCDIETDRDGYDIFVKDISRLHQVGYRNFVIIDDRPENIRPNSDTVIAVKPYYGSRDDMELLKLSNAIFNSVV